MKKTCEKCTNCHNEYILGGYPTPVCKIYGYLEEIDNPHHDLDGEKCSDYTIIKDEIVRCKDCKHRPVKTKDDKGRSDLEFPDYKCPCQCDDYYYSWYPSDDWFCAEGEKR